MPIKIRLVDANGINVSSEATVIHAVSVVQTGSQASPILDDAGNANPDFDFRYDATLGGYIFNLRTAGYETESCVLNFVAGTPMRRDSLVVPKTTHTTVQNPFESADLKKSVVPISPSALRWISRGSLIGCCQTICPHRLVYQSS